jgi:hypothetical protein
MSDTELDLEAIEARLAAITPGKWKFDEAADRPLFVDKDNFLVWVGHIFEGDVELAMEKADGEFIANAPIDIAALVAEVHRLRQKLNQQAEDDHTQYNPDDLFFPPYPDEVA